MSGRKIFSTGSYGLHWLLVWAATADDDPEGLRSGTFVVPAYSRGIRVIHTWDHLGMRATASHDVVLDDVAIPAHYAFDLRPPGTHPPYGGDPVITGWLNLARARSGAVILAAISDPFEASCRCLTLQDGRLTLSVASGQRVASIRLRSSVRSASGKFT